MKTQNLDPRTLRAWLVPLAALTAIGAPVLAAGDCTEIHDVPTVIGEPGMYCLTKSFETSLTEGAAIEIQADHVTLDLGGHTVDNTRAGQQTLAAGIHSSEREHLVVANGTLVGFRRAVDLDRPLGTLRSDGHRVEGLRVLSSRETGIRIAGDDAIVRGNSVWTTGGQWPPITVSGILLRGARNRVIDNDVIATLGPYSAAIRFLEGDSNIALDNRISSATIAVYFPPNRAGIYRDTLANEIPCCTPFVGGTDAGGNLAQ